MSRAPLEAFLASDIPVPVPDDASERIQERMFAALESHAYSTVAKLDDDVVVIDIDIGPGGLLRETNSESRWTRRPWDVLVVASIVLFAGVALFVIGNGGSSQVDTSPVTDSVVPIDETADDPANLERLNTFCADYLSGLEQWTPELGSIDDAQIGAALSYLRPMIDDLEVALDSLASNEQLDAIRFEVVSIERQLSREEAAPSNSDSIHVLPLVARRLRAVLAELSDLGYRSCTKGTFEVDNE